MRIGIIGAGQIGGTLTRRLAALGHEVWMPNSRGTETLAELAAEANDIATGSIRLILERVYGFEDAVAALEKTETRHARGKLVVTVPSGS